MPLNFNLKDINISFLYYKEIKNHGWMNRVKAIVYKMCL